MKYRVILADPPWQFNDRRETRRDNPARAAKFGTGVQRRYSAGTMPQDVLCSLGPLIQSIAAPDAYLFLWVCESQPYAHIELAEAWGFRLINTAFAWVKTNLRSGTPHFGTGKYTAGNIERCLLARNNTARSAKCWHDSSSGCYKPRQVVMESHPRDQNGKIIHSRKPATIHREIEKWLGGCIDGMGMSDYLTAMGMLELFATQCRPGWTTLGHALSGNDIADDLRELAGLLQVAV